MPVQITQVDIDEMERLLYEDENRAGAYLYYYELIKNENAAAGRQLLIQAQITTYSGYFGGAALIGNAIAKVSNPDHYTISLDDFSVEIVQGVIDAIAADLAGGGSGVLTQSDIQDADRGVWDAHQMGAFFPGNIQMYHQGADVLFSEGSLAAVLAGMQLTFGARVGTEASQVSGTSYETSDYRVIEDANGKILWIEDKLNILNDVTGGFHDEPAIALATNAVRAFTILSAVVGTPATAALVALGVKAIASNEAASNAVGAGVTHLIKSMFEDTETNDLLSINFRKFLGADGYKVDPTVTMPEKLVWDDFGVIMRHEGDFNAGSNPNILIGFNSAQADAEGGQDIVVGFAQSELHGGAGNDWLLAKAQAKIFGDAGNDLLLGFQHSKLYGGDNNDWLVHFGSGEANGDAGNDIVVAAGSVYNGPDDKLELRGGEGSDKLISLGGAGAFMYGGTGEDWLIGWGGEDHLWGGDGSGADGATDVFSVSKNTFIEDAGTEDYTFWGPFPLFGGVQQWWMDGGWAYWTPITGVTSGVPLPFLNVFGALAVLLDVGAALTFRYGLSESGQLIIQLGGGRGGQAVIENYELNTDTGAASGHIVAFKQVMSWEKGDYRQYLNLALKAGFGVGLRGADPLVLDLDGDGLDLIRQDAGLTYFDIDNDGFAERTAWVDGDDGLLARDLNANGTIDGIAELFGNATTPGFTALSALDSNADGKTSGADAAFGTLRVWRDLDGDGVTDAGELKTLAESNISEISLTTQTPADDYIRGNTIRAEASFTRADGTTSTISDVLLENSQLDSRYLGDTTVSPEAAALPNLKGYGNVVDLAVAMTDDPTLLAQVTAFKNLAATTTWTALKDAADDILLRWAGVDTVPADPLGGGAFDTRKLAFLEKYFGYALAPRDGAGAPVAINVDELVSSWEGVLNQATLRLAAQGPLHATFADLPFDVAADRFFADGPATLANAYAAAIGQLSPTPSVALGEWSTHWGPLLAEYTDALVRADGRDIRTDYAVQSLVHALDGAASPLTLPELVAGLDLDGVQVGTAGADALARGSATGLQIYVAGAGNDSITGGVGQDVYVFGRGFGQDTVTDIDAGDMGDRVRLALHNREDVTITREGVDLVIRINGTTDKIAVKDQFETPQVTFGGLPMSADKGVEEIQFADGTVYEAIDIATAIGLGTSGNDTIDGTGTADEIEGLQGDDLLRGGDSGDAYYFSQGDGDDTIHDLMTNPLLNGADTLFLLGDTKPADLVLTRQGDSTDLTIGFTSGGDSITIKDQFAYSALGYQTKLATDNRIEVIFFGSSAAWSWLDIQANVINTYTTDAAETTYGFGTSDDFYSSAGNDTLVGLDGGDTYRFELGSGNDLIHDQQQYPETFISGLIGYSWGADDVLEFGAGILLGDVTFSRPDADPDLLITINSTGETITIKDQFDGAKLDLFGLLGVAWFDRIEEFRFADDTVLDWEDVLAIVTTGSAGDDALYGAYYADTIDGKAGTDFMSGGDDGDTYLFGLGYGQDTIEDRQTNVLTQTADTVRFGAGIAVADVAFQRDGTSKDLAVTIAGAPDTLRVQNQYQVFETGPFGAQAFNAIERFEWADGTVKTWTTLRQEIITAAKTAGDDLIVGSHFDDVLDGGAGNDRLDGENGNDVYLFGPGYGADVIHDSQDSIFAGKDDKVTFGAGIAPADVTIARVGATDVRLTFAGLSDQLTIEGQFDYGVFNTRFNAIETFEFAGGATWTEAELRVNYLAQANTAGNDTIEGFFSDDLIVSGAGNDVLRGGDGSDTYSLAAGFGDDAIEETLVVYVFEEDDTVEFGAGITAAATLLARDGNDLIITFSGSADRLTVADQFANAFGKEGWWDIETFRFADATVWTDDQVREMLIDAAGTSGNDTIVGFFGADLIDGGAGNDSLQGGGGGDTYVFGKGSGQDTVLDTWGSVYEDHPDTIAFAANTARAEVGFQVVGNDLLITIAGHPDTLTLQGHATSTVNRIEFFKFADGATLSAADVAAGAAQAQSTAGNDTITGTNADEVFDGGAGNDTISGRVGADTYVFGIGSGQDVFDEDGNWSSMFAETFVDKVSFGAGVALADLALTRSGNDLVIAIDGTSDQLTIRGQFLSTDSFWNQDRFEGFAFADGLNLTGADVDVLVLQGQASAGNDTMLGYDSIDTLDGLAGNDTLTGAKGADTFIFGRGSGQDLIDDNGEVSSLSASSTYDVVASRPTCCRPT